MPQTSIDQALATAVEHHRAGRLAEAESIYRQVLQQQPDNANALHLLGLIALDAGQPEAAADLIRRAIAATPQSAPLYVSLGRALRLAGRPAEAVATFEQATRLAPRDPHAWLSLGNVLFTAGDVRRAETAYRTASTLAPQDAIIRNNLAAVLIQLDREDEAAAVCETAMKDSGANAQLYGNLIAAKLKAGRCDDAVAAATRAVQLWPSDAAAHANLGAASFQQGRVPDAINSLRRAVQLNPTSAVTHSRLAYALHFSDRETPDSILAEHRAWGDRHVAPLLRAAAPHENAPDPDGSTELAEVRRLRVAYLGPFFRDHVVARNLQPVLAAHDHAQFEIICYADIAAEDATTRRLRTYADAWHTVFGLPEEQLASLIRSHCIDILVDLSGQMPGYRALSRKPAPIQVFHMGYPATTGNPAIDYRISDPYLDPPQLGNNGSTETIIRLPHSFWCFAPQPDWPDVSFLPADTNGHITFGCLNNIPKVSNSAVALWSRALHAVPHSRILVLGTHPSDSCQHVRDAFAANAIPPDRVEIVPRRPAIEYLQLYSRIDIGLDPLPYNGHTTSCESFWMGVPVLTLPGDTPVSRGGASLLSNLGLTDLIASSPEHFATIAASLTSDLPRLRALRAGLRDRMRSSPLMDAAGYTRALESAYRQMWHTWCARR